MAFYCINDCLDRHISMAKQILRKGLFVSRAISRLMTDAISDLLSGIRAYKRPV